MARVKTKLKLLIFKIEDDHAVVDAFYESEVPSLHGWRSKRFPRLSTVELAEASYESATWPPREEPKP